MLQDNSFLNKTFVTITLVVAIGILSRIVPHAPNVTPLVCLSLFVGRAFSSWLALLSVLIILSVSDALLSLFFGYPLFSSCTLFTYVAFLSISIVGKTTFRLKNALPLTVLSSSFGFWVWSNFGVWVSANLYSKTLSGFVTCYVAALPFLRNSLVGDMIWGIVVFGVASKIFAIVTGSKSFSFNESQVQ